MSSSTYDPEADRRYDVDAELEDPSRSGGWPESVDIWAGWVPRFEPEDPTPGPSASEPAGPGRTGAEPTVPVDPAVAACARLAEALDTLAGLPVDLVGNDSVLSVVDVLMAGQNRTAGLLARYVREVDVRGLYPPTWAGNPTATYLQHRYRLRPSAAARLADRAREVVQTLPTVGQAMIDGSADAAQADAIITGMDLLPGTAGPEVCELVLANLIDHCDDSDPLALLNRAEDLAKRLTVVSEDGLPPPDDGEQTAHERRHLSVRNVPGGVEGDFFAPEEQAALIVAFLDQLAGPDDAGHGDPADPAGRDTRTIGQRNIDALLEAIGHRLACGKDIPPPATTIIVALRLDELTARLTGSQLNDTGPLSASVVRRLCCEGALIPAVLDGRSVPLDLGRAQRLFTAGQRHALTVRDRGCSFPGCDQPPLGCHAHSEDGGVRSCSWSDSHAH